MTRNQRVLVLAAVVVVLLAAVVVALVVRDDEEPVADPPPGLEAVQTWDDLSTDHVGTDEVDYPQSPPVGGPHNDAWLNCGVYDREVREENAAHSLEHGAVWITYQPGLAADDIDALAAKLPDEGLLSPVPDQEAPVMVTVWGAQLALEGPDDPLLDQFVEEYEDGHTTEEAYAPCSGGLEAFEEQGSSGV